MRLSQVIIYVSAEDLNRAIAELAPDVKARVTRIDADGIHGEVRLWVWSIDFVARPSLTPDGQVDIQVSAQKLVPIPSAIVEHQLRMAVKDAPAGVDVIQQALRVHLPVLLRPLGISLALRELRTVDGYLRIAAEAVEFPAPRPGRATGSAATAEPVGEVPEVGRDPGRPRITFADGDRAEL